MPLDKDMIRQPQQWQLIMEISRDTLHVMAFSYLEHHAMISEAIPLDRSLPQARAFQEAVYANPLLLADFRSVTVLIPSERFLVAPDFVKGPTEIHELFNRAFSPADIAGPEELLSEPLPTLKATMITGIGADLAGFLRRTFNNPRICHTLSPQALYFKAKHPTRPYGKMMANISGNRCDIIILGDDAPLVLNSFEVRHPMDAVYYIMGCRESSRLRSTDEIILAGQPEMRRETTPLLRRYINYVIPAIFPSVIFRAGSACLRLPFEMVVTPLVYDPGKKN